MSVITCNDIRKLNGFIVNRPGRFHYHFRFEYPSAEEIRTYLRDKLDKSYYDEIELIVAFSRKVDLNYDCLRAIAFEINNGESFQSSVKDLNIINLSQEYYDFTLHFKNGSPMCVKNRQADFFADEEVRVYQPAGSHIVCRRVRTKEEFQRWIDIVNYICLSFRKL